MPEGPNTYSHLATMHSTDLSHDEDGDDPVPVGVGQLGRVVDDAVRHGQPAT